MTREEAIEYVNAQLDKAVDDVDFMDDEMYEALQTLVKIAEQEPFINKSCISQGVCCEDKAKVLDKIRAEIENIDTNYYRSVNGIDMTECADDFKNEILNIIAKYKTENGKMLICPECGLDVHSDYKKCPRCGARMGSEVEE